MYAIGNDKILKIICYSFLWDILWWVNSARQFCCEVRSTAKRYSSDWWLLAINICSSSLSCSFCRLGVAGCLWIALVSGSSRGVSGSQEVELERQYCTLWHFPFMCLRSMMGGSNHKQIISVKAEGSKGTWAGVQGCVWGAELCMCKQRRQRYLWPTALCLRFAVSFAICQIGFEDGQQNSSGIKVHLHICVPNEHTHSYTQIQKLLGETSQTLSFLSPLSSC